MYMRQPVTAAVSFPKKNCNLSTSNITYNRHRKIVWHDNNRYVDVKLIIKCENELVICRYRCLRYWLEGASQGLTEIFIDNLPGLPDNIHLHGASRTFWIGIVGVSIHKTTTRRMVEYTAHLCHYGNYVALL